ncbi:hypothetical protein OAM67_00625 [bacterium]|nr:hypothetical protein [bacterium]
MSQNKITAVPVQRCAQDAHDAQDTNEVTTQKTSVDATNMRSAPTNIFVQRTVKLMATILLLKTALAHFQHDSFPEFELCSDVFTQHVSKYTMKIYVLMLLRLHCNGKRCNEGQIQTRLYNFGLAKPNIDRLVYSWFENASTYAQLLFISFAAQDVLCSAGRCAHAAAMANIVEARRILIRSDMNTLETKSAEIFRYAFHSATRTQLQQLKTHVSKAQGFCAFNKELDKVQIEFDKMAQTTLSYL